MRTTAIQLGVVMLLSLPLGALAQGPSPQAFATLDEQAGALSRLHTVVVAVEGEVVHEFHQGGPGTRTPANVKSLSKTVLAAITGAAIEAGVIDSTQMRLVELLGSRVPGGVDPRVNDITVENLLSMQAGLERTSGENYSGWVASSNWVENALRRPFVDEPGGRMLYSTGSSHLVSAGLTYYSDESTYALAQRLLAEPLEITIPRWLQDPQGVYFGGNDMQLSPRSLVEIGELYRLDGVVGGERILPEGFVADSWTPRGRSPWTGDGYGLGWFVTTLANTPVYYGRGYGGQALFVIPARDMTVVITSDPTPPSPGGQFQQQLNRLVANLLSHAEG
ncbi:serine hydrolase domain-containing protein [Halomonas sp. HNIBRBA4712]|uniref:serine hydrolase domain-containing protein n=1 Tax=Halomonas sp. HNIBRBA4712 TaxID=3373087 RepID=UPI0037465D90